MDNGKTLKAKMIGRDSVVPRCAVLMLCTYGVVYMLHMWCCVHVVYAVLCTYGIVYMLYVRCCAHVVCVVLCTYGAMCMLYV